MISFAADYRRASHLARVFPDLLASQTTAFITDFGVGDYGVVMQGGTIDTMLAVRSGTSK